MEKHGEGARQYHLFTPEDPKPERVPLVVFLHGWGGMDPTLYGAWIKHLVRRGNIVVFPRFQADLRTLPGEMSQHVVAALEDAIARLESGDLARPDLDRVAFVGHSMGAILGANIAQRGGKLKLPIARAIFAAEPTFEPLLGGYDQIPGETLLVVAVGAEVKRDASARRILLGSSRIPSENKTLVAIPSDQHGNPPLISDHFAPCAAESFDESLRESASARSRGRTRDALDYYGYWKLCDGLLDAAFFNRNRQYVFGNSPEQRFMGVWSDGTPVQEATAIDPAGEPIAPSRDDPRGR